MSIIKAILQAIGQAITWVFPISESGHSSMFHDFSARYTNACSQITGVIHIGIAIGIIIAFYKMFLHLSKNFFGTWNDIFHKRFSVKNSSSQRKFMLMTVLSFAPMILYLIPAGKYGNIYDVFDRTSYDSTLLGEGICIALTGVLLMVVNNTIDKKINPLPQWAQALILGVIAFMALPTSGCAFIGGIFCVAVLIGISEKYALRYSMVMSVPTLIVMGITEICDAVTKTNVAAAIFAIVVAAAITYFAVRILQFVIKIRAFNYFAFYDITIGCICLVVGIYEIIVK